MVFKVAIVGGGPAGLTLAAALAIRPGVSVVVFEQNASHLEAPEYNANRSYTIDITGHGANAIRYLGAKAAFDDSLLNFKGVELSFTPGKTFQPVEGAAWTGSRGSICQVKLCA